VIEVILVFLVQPCPLAQLNKVWQGKSIVGDSPSKVKTKKTLATLPKSKPNMFACQLNLLGKARQGKQHVLVAHNFQSWCNHLCEQK
jgi:hypothetical protein